MFKVDASLDKSDIFSPGDQVICIGMNPNYRHKLKIGDIYTIARIKGDNNDNKWLYVKENNSIDCYELIYFEHVSPTKALLSSKNRYRVITGRKIP